MSAPQNDFQDDGTIPAQNDYESRTGQKDHIPVQKDEAGVEDPIDPNVADSDEQLGENSHEQFGLESTDPMQNAMTLTPLTRATSLTSALVVPLSHTLNLATRRVFLAQRTAQAVSLADQTRCDHDS
jgi:hypothetical protein